MEQEIINILVGIMGFITGICVADIIDYIVHRKKIHWNLEKGEKNEKFRSIRGYYHNSF